MKIPQSVRELIEKGPLAHLTTLNRDGSPQVTLIWVGIEDDEFVIGHLARASEDQEHPARSAGRAVADQRQTSAQGMREYVVVYGNARITEGGAVPLLQRLAPLYLGPKADFPPSSMRKIPGYITRIAPERFSGIGPWAAKAR